MLKILICGATGFIGQNLAEHFAAIDNFEVTGTYFKSKPLPNTDIKMMKVDLTNKAESENVIKGKDIIIMASAVTSGAKDIISKPYIHVTDNVIMNSIVFRAAFKHKVKHVLFPSCTIMYQSSDVALKESDFDANDEIFPSYFGAGWMKVYCEKQAEFFSRIGETKYTAFRHSNVYGPFDKYDLEKSHVFGATITKVLTNKDGKIVVWGSGETGRDLIYISDIISFIEAAIEKQEKMFELFNVGIGKAVSIKELVEKIISISGKKIQIQFDHSQPDIKTNLFLDCSKAKKQLGWQPSITLEQGIEKTIEWYRANILN